MKKKILFLLFLLCYISGKAQEDMVLNSDQVDKKPEFAGGSEGFDMFLGAYFKMPDSDDFKGGEVISSFIVDKNGALSDIKILKDPGFGAGEEVRRLLNICQKWIPAELNGKKIKVRHVFPVQINVAPPSDDVIKDLSKLESSPSFPGGISKFYQFIGQNFRVPNESLSGKILVRFMIDTDGSLVDINIIRHLGYGTDEETIRVLKKSPKWMPGRQDGKAVKTALVLPITIQEPARHYNSAEYNQPKFYLNGRSKRL